LPYCQLHLNEAVSSGRRQLDYLLYGTRDTLYLFRLASDNLELLCVLSGLSTDPHNYLGQIAMKRISTLLYIPFLSLAVVAIQSSGEIVLVRIARILMADGLERFEMELEQRITLQRQHGWLYPAVPIVGVAVTVAPGPGFGKQFVLHVVGLDGMIQAFDLERVRPRRTFEMDMALL